MGRARTCFDLVDERAHEPPVGALAITKYSVIASTSPTANTTMSRALLVVGARGGELGDRAARRRQPSSSSPCVDSVGSTVSSGPSSPATVASVASVTSGSSGRPRRRVVRKSAPSSMTSSTPAAVARPRRTRRGRAVRRFSTRRDGRRRRAPPSPSAASPRQVDRQRRCRRRTGERVASLATCVRDRPSASRVQGRRCGRPGRVRRRDIARARCCPKTRPARLGRARRRPRPGGSSAAGS